MRVLVTGGAGFIGGHVVAGLLAAGRVVRVLDPEQPDNAAADHHPGSVTDPDCVAAALQGVDAVIHLAAQAHLWLPDKAAYDRINHHGTRVVLAAAQAAGVARMIHVSSEVVFAGPGIRNGQPADETLVLAETDMLGPYCVSKWRAEQAALEAAAAGLPLLVVSPSAPLGPGDRRLTPPTEMIRRLLNGELPAYLDAELAFIDVRDAAAAIIAALDRGQVGERYILNQHSLRLGALIAELAAVTGRRMPRARVPYALAWLAAAVDEAVADFTKRPPTAPLTGVRLARHAPALSAAKAKAGLALAERPLAETLRDTAAWLSATGRLRVPLT